MRGVGRITEESVKRDRAGVHGQKTAIILDFGLVDPNQVIAWLAFGMGMSEMKLKEHRLLTEDGNLVFSGWGKGRKYAQGS